MKLEALKRMMIRLTDIWDILKDKLENHTTKTPSLISFVQEDAAAAKKTTLAAEKVEVN
jgi:hypothetical protein